MSEYFAYRTVSSNFALTAALFLIPLFLILTDRAMAQEALWAGTWEAPKIMGYQSVEITLVSKTGLAGRFDEGVGINGMSFDIDATFLTPTLAKGTVTILDKDCSYTLTLRGTGTVRTLELKNSCGYAQMGEGNNDTFLTLLAPGTKNYYQAGFDCNKASTLLEIGICESQDLAIADQSVSKSYTTALNSLDHAAQTRLRDEQRTWVATRNNKCGNAKEEMTRCLMRQYGLRQFHLFALVNYGLWLQGNPDYKQVAAVVKASRFKHGAIPNLLDSGLTLWLSGYMGARIQTHLGSLDPVSDPEFNNGAFIIRAAYSPDATQGFDPAGIGRVVFIGFFETQGVWVGDSYFDPTIYTPHKHNGKEPRQIQEWKSSNADAHSWQIQNVFP